jgi:hypothetical protein
MLEWVPPAAPLQRNLIDVQFKGDVQVAAWRQRRGFSSQVHDDPATLGLSQNALAYILMEIESRRTNSHALNGPLHEAMVELTPQLSQPHSKSEVEALAHVFSQPEMQAFWAAWKSARPRNARGAVANVDAVATSVGALPAPAPPPPVEGLTAGTGVAPRVSPARSNVIAVDFLARRRAS